MKLLHYSRGKSEISEIEKIKKLQRIQIFRMNRLLTIRDDGIDSTSLWNLSILISLQKCISTRTRYRDKSSCDSRLHVSSLRGVFYRPSEFREFRSLTGKFVGDRLVLKFKLRKYFTSAHGRVSR